MNKTYLILLALCVSLLASDTPTKTGDFPEKEMKAQNKEIAKLVAEEISSTLPQVVNKFTTITSVKSQDTTIVYTFEINTGAKSDETVRNEDRTKMSQAITTGICQSSSKFLQAGINTTYLYVSAKTKANLFRFDIL
jgi:hypothetical protein